LPANEQDIAQMWAILICEMVYKLKTKQKNIEFSTYKYFRSVGMNNAKIRTDNLKEEIF
jgi:hypothetical protein